MTSCIANEMGDREYCPLSPEGILRESEIPFEMTSRMLLSGAE